jgi:acetylornithine deacetylase/succinyl-diaminopimelate desuccinylase-like protein
MPDVVDLCSALIANACVNDGTPDSGGEVRSVETITGFLGPGASVVEPHRGRASVVYRTTATDPDAPTLLLMGHLDVVPVTEATWTRDPFGGSVVDGVLWGRGAVDMLNLTAAMAVVYARVRDGSLPTPPGGLAFLAVADEEAGGALGAEWLLDHEPSLVACDDLLTEIAYPAIDLGGGPRQPVMVAEKGPAWRTLHATGTPGHASAPYGRSSALETLVRAVSALVATETEPCIGSEWRAFVGALGLPDDLAGALTDPSRVDGVVAEIATSDPGIARYIHACTRMTVTPTVASAGTKANTIPDQASVALDMRLLPGQPVDTARHHLRSALGADLGGLEDEPHIERSGSASPSAGRLWEALTAAYRSTAGVESLVPAMTTATTDARFFRDRGVTAYGAGWFDDSVGFGEFLDMFHGNDERIAVEALHRTVDLLGAVVSAYAR